MKKFSHNHYFYSQNTSKDTFSSNTSENQADSLQSDLNDENDDKTDNDYSYYSTPNYSMQNDNNSTEQTEKIYQKPLSFRAINMAKQAEKHRQAIRNIESE